MPIDDRSSPAGETYPPTGAAETSGELYDAAERLERTSWQRAQDEAARYGGAPPAGPDHQAGAIVTFLETQLRDRPIPTLLAAVAAGWLVGKVLR